MSIKKWLYFQGNWLHRKTLIKNQNYLCNRKYIMDKDIKNDVDRNETQGLNVVQSFDAKETLQLVSNYMKQTQYWGGQEKQTITPDFLNVSKEKIEQIKNLANLESIFLRNVINQYKKDVLTGSDTLLTKYIEGDLQSGQFIETLKNWCITTPPMDPVNYFRPDLGVDTDGNIYLCELNIITAGTPPAILYRLAQEKLIKKQALQLPTVGSLEYFWGIAEKDPQKSLTILGVSPTKANQELYEGSHKDMCDKLKDLGIDANYARINDLEIKDGKLYLPKSTKSISNIYWRIPPFQTETFSELASEQGQLLLKLYSNEIVKIMPTPALPFMNNKALEVIVWDDNFLDLIPDGLRSFIPETKWLDKKSALYKQIMNKETDYKDYVIKKARGDGGVTLGKETEYEYFRERIVSGSNTPMAYVIQRFISPARIGFRTKYRDSWKTREYYLRIEPTIAINETGDAIITDLFFTGRYDTLKVGGGSESIMGIITTN